MAVSDAPHPSHAGIVSLYQRHAGEWARLRGPSAVMEAAWLARFEQALPPPREAGGPRALLDLGCGTGQPMAGWLIARGHALTGVDASAPLLREARARWPAARWLEADMRTLSLPERFDGLLAWDSFFHLCPDDQRRMMGVFAAHAAPGAALMFTSGPAAGEAIGEFAGEPLYHASLDPAEYRALLAAAGFELLMHRAQDPDCGGHTVWLARRGP